LYLAYRPPEGRLTGRCRVTSSNKGRGYRDGRGMGTCGLRVLLGARGRLPGGTVSDRAPDAGGDGRPGLPDIHGAVPSIRGPLLGQGVQLRLVAWHDYRPDH